MQFGRVLFEICERTDRQTYVQTYRHAYGNTAPTYREKNVQQEILWLEVLKIFIYRLI